MDYKIIAESTVHSERRLLIGREGRGYIQLDASSKPIAVPERDFARLRSMRHYRPVRRSRATARPAVLSRQIAD